MIVSRVKGYWIEAVLGALAITAVIGTVSLIRGAHLAIEAENRFHAAIIVHTALVHFESDHKRRPTDWDDLAQVSPIVSGGMRWPRDRITIQQLVEVDFDALQHADPASDAIHPTGIIYGGWESIVYDQPEQRR